MPSEKATALSRFLRISRKRSLLNLTLELKVKETLFFFKLRCDFWKWVIVIVFITGFVPFSLTGIYGGFLLGVRSVNGLAFYDWENTELIRRIEIQPKHVRQVYIWEGNALLLLRKLLTSSHLHCMQLCVAYQLKMPFFVCMQLNP